MQRCKRFLRLVPVLVLLLSVGLFGCDIEDDPVDPDAAPVAEAVPTPLSGAVEQSLPLRLSWSLSSDVAWADTFRVLADTTRPPRVEVYAGVDTACVLTDLLDGQTYYWQVAAADSGGGEHLFGPWSFAVRPFRCRVLPDPEDRTLNLETDPVLAWRIDTASDTPAYYLAYADTVNPPRDLVYAGPDSSVRLDDLAYETEYFWRVTAVDAGDNTDTSGPWRFTTGPPAFLVDVAPTPADSTADLDRVVTLTWDVVETTAPVENWVVFLDEDPHPVTMVHSGTDSTVVLENLRYGRTYYWSVTAFDADLHTFTCGPWELSIREFEVAAAPAPADGSSQVATTGTLSWEPTVGADMVVNWLVTLDTTAQPTTPVYTGPATSLDLAGLGLRPDTTYHWRATALDADGFTCPLGPWSFTTAP